MKKVILIFIAALTINAQGFICAVGGGSEDNGGWSDKPYGWIVQQADSGKIIVISYDDNSSWLPNYFKSLGASESYIINVDNSSIANAQSTYDDIKSAKGIFIKGGNQELYYDRMNGTLSEQAIIEVYQSGGVIGGTSAGAMVLSEFSSLDTVYPDEALENPLTGYINIKDDFINIMPNVLFDTHFIQRGRWGRLIGFIYNVYHHNNREIVGVGIDDQTAICIDDQMIGTVYGTGAVSIFQIDEQTRILDQGTDYTIEKLKCDQLVEGWSFDFNSNTISHIPESARAVDLGEPEYYSMHDAYIYGGDDFYDIFNPYFIRYLDDYSATKFGLVYNQEYDIYVDAVADSLNNRGINFVRIPISSELVNSQSLAETIESCGAFILLSNNLETMNLLEDAQTNVGNAFYQKRVSNNAFYFHGNTVKLNGSYLVDGTDSNPNAAYYGRMEMLEGLANTPSVIYQNDIFEDSDYYENRSASLLYGMMRTNQRIGVYLDSDDYMIINSAINKLELRSDRMPIMIVDGSERTFVDSSKYKMSSTSDERQVVAMNNLRYSVSTLEKWYDLVDGTLSPITSVEENENEQLTNDFVLYSNYPNPFNPVTKIKFNLNYESTQNVSLRVFNILGEKVATLIDKPIANGLHEISFDASDLSSGVYFYRLSIGSNFQTKKMLLLK